MEVRRATDASELPPALQLRCHRDGIGRLASAVEVEDRLRFLPLGLVAIRRGRRRAGLALLALLAVQVALGVLMVVYALPLPLALGHNLVAAVMLAVVVQLP